MPYKDLEKQKEYQRLWAKNRRKDAVRNARHLEIRRLWRLRNKEKLRAHGYYKNIEKKRASDNRYNLSEKRKLARKRYFLNNRQKIIYKLKIYKSKKQYGEFWEAHRELIKIIQLQKEIQNGKTKGK